MTIFEAEAAFTGVNCSNGAGSCVLGGGHWLHKRNYERPQRVYERHNSDYDRLERVYVALERN